MLTPSKAAIKGLVATPPGPRHRTAAASGHELLGAVHFNAQMRCDERLQYDGAALPARTVAEVSRDAASSKLTPFIYVASFWGAMLFFSKHQAGGLQSEHSPEQACGLQSPILTLCRRLAGCNSQKLTAGTRYCSWRRNAEARGARSIHGMQVNEERNGIAVPTAVQFVDYVSFLCRETKTKLRADWNEYQSSTIGRLY